MSSHYNRALQILTDTDTHLCFLAIFYVLLRKELFDFESLIWTLTLVSTLGIYLSQTFFINDFFDMSYDLAAGKKRLVQDIPKVYSIGILVLMFLVSFGIVFFVIKDSYYTLLYFITYFLGIFYSAPPLRLKDKWVIGLFADMLIERTCPLLLVLVFFKFYEWDGLWLLFVFSVFQLELILHHQIDDYKADLNTGIRTFVISIGYQRALKLLKSFIQPLTSVLILSSFVVFAYKLGPYGIPIFLLIIGYLPVLALFKKGYLVQEEDIIPLYLKYEIVMSSIALPFFFGLLLVIQYSYYVFLLLLVTISMSPYLGSLKRYLI